MANTRDAILTALATELEDLSAVKKATLQILPMSRIENNVPYIGIVAGDEINQVEDSTEIRWMLQVHIFIVTEHQYADVETLMDVIKNSIYNSGEALTLTNNVLDKNISAIYPTQIEDVDEDRFSSSRMEINIIYYTTKTDI